MDTDIVVSKRKRGRPRKVNTPLPVITEEIIETPVVEPVQEPEQKIRKSNPWIELCKEVQKRPENV